MSDATARLRAFLTEPARRPWLLGALAIATRAASALTAVVIHPDSPRYLKMATLIGQAKFGEACRLWPWSHPLYSIFIAFGEVFEKFKRLEDPLRMETGGAGLGLFIVRQLARAMGGEASVESELGRGSTFTVTLTVSSSSVAAAPPERRAQDLAG